MRKDMPKVIVERPRILESTRRKGRAVSTENLPKRIGLKRDAREHDGWKRLNENLKPLGRYLAKQAGRPWDKVYSEICATLRPTSTVQQHVRDHLKDLVAIHPRIQTHSVWLPDGSRQRRSQLWYQPLYVDPRDGILKRTERLELRRDARLPWE